MSPSLEVDDQIYDLLRREAEPFVDTPNSVLRRLLGLAEAHGENGAAPTRAGTPGELSRPPAASRRSSRSPSNKARLRSRAPAGSILPEEEYIQPVLRSLVEAGGSAPSREIIELVGQMLDGRLTDLDRAPLGSGGIRWHNRVQFVRLRLIERGLMTRDAPRGVWAITDKGRESATSNMSNSISTRGGTVEAR